MLLNRISPYKTMDPQLVVSKDIRMLDRVNTDTIKRGSLNSDTQIVGTRANLMKLAGDKFSSEMKTLIVKKPQDK